jgi:PilZ domain
MTTFSQSTSDSTRTNDRRRKQRFPLNREVRYRLLQEANSEQSIGTAINASSTGLAFQCDRSLPVNALIEFSVSWPVSLQDTCPLRLVGKGRVVRCDGHSVACTIDKFEFRTQARNLTNLRDALASVAIVRPQPAVCMA